MLEKVKADLKKNWVSWLGLAGLIVIFGVYLLRNPQQLLMVIFFWVLVIWGMAIEAGYEKQKETNEQHR